MSRLRSFRGGLVALVLVASVVAWTLSIALVLRAAIPDGERLTLAGVAPSLVVLFLASTGALVLGALWLHARATRALARTAALLAARGPNATGPLDATDAPVELRPLLEEVEALALRYAAALEAERRFTAAAAHELRTPLAAVRVQAQVVERARTPQDAREALAQLHVCVDRASRTIDQLLMLAQFEAAKVAPETTTTVELAALAARVIEDMNPLLRSRGIALSLNLEPVAVSGLEHGLAALVRNLIDNAARHSPPNSRLHVTSGAASTEAFVAVEDSGPGIPPAERDRVFERFYRLPSEHADGVGVGLSIVQSVARSHGGRIELSDSDLGGLRAAFFLSQDYVRQVAASQASATARAEAGSADAANIGEVGNHPPTPRG